MRVKITAIIIVLVGITISAGILKSGSVKPCSKPINLVAYIAPPTTMNPVMTEPEFVALVDQAIAEWETATGIDLFNRVDKNNILSKSGLASEVVYYPEKAGGELAGKNQVIVDDTMFLAEIYTPKLNVIVHELGHSRLVGHSDNPKDLMYYMATAEKLSKHDIKAMIDYCNPNDNLKAGLNGKLTD